MVSVVIRVTNDVLMCADDRKCFILLLLDLSVTFDTVKYLNRLDQFMGLSGTALKWFESYLSNREFSVSIRTYVSSSIHIHWCARCHRDLLLVQLCFPFYMLPLGNIISPLSLLCWWYANLQTMSTILLNPVIPI